MNKKIESILISIIYTLPILLMYLYFTKPISKIEYLNVKKGDCFSYIENGKQKERKII